VVAGAIYDASGSYDAFLIFGVAGTMLSSWLIFRLGDYPDWTRKAG
jgi:hypothetical protein